MTIKPTFSACKVVATRAARTSVLVLVVLTIGVVATSSVAQAQPQVQRIGPSGGTLTDFAFSRVGPQIVYAAGTTGNRFVYRIRGLADGSLPSQEIADAVSFLGQLGADVSVHPSSPDIVFSGRFRSTDAGQTWDELPDVVRVLAVNPLADDVLWARGQHSLLQSRDAGETWIGIAQVDLRELAVSPSDTSALLGQTTSSLLRSADGGVTWSEVNPPEAPRSIAVAPDDSGLLFAGAAGGLYRSDDAGTTWSLVLEVGPVDHIEIDPSGAARLFVVAAKAIRYSADGGETWSLRQEGIEAPVSVVRIDPKDPEIMVAGTEETGYFDSPGAFQSTDGGGTWSSVLISTVRFSAEPLTLDPNVPGRVIVNMQRSPGSLFSDDGGFTWNPLDFGTPTPVAVFDVEFAPADPSQVWANLIHHNPLRSVALHSQDAGKSWREVLGDNMLGSTFMRTVIHPVDSDRVVIYKHIGSLYVTEDGAVNLAYYHTVLPGVMHEVAFAPSDPDVFFASTRLYPDSPRRLLVTHNGGQTWTIVDDDGRVSGRLHMTGASSPMLYVAAGLGGLFRSGIDTIHWEEVEVTHDPDPAGISVIDVIGSPFDPSVLYISTSRGVFLSTDDGSSWDQVTDLVLNRLRADPHEAGTLWGASFILGIFRITGLPVSSESAPSGPVTFELSAPYPNPTREGVTIPFELDQAAAVTIAVYDVLGRRVANLVDGPFSFGRHEVSFSSSALVGGVYLIRMVAASEDGHSRVSTQRLTVTR